MKKLYKTYLRKWLACKKQIELFEEHYPYGIDICAECFKEAEAKGLRVAWLVYRVTREALASGPEPRYLGWTRQGQRRVTKAGFKFLEKTMLQMKRP